MHPVPLACTVRGCSLPLVRRDRAFVCGAGHSFDIARRGYVNLLQPQDRRSRRAGDSREAVTARASLLDAGVGRRLVETVARLLSELELPADAIAVDLGCGSGDALSALSHAHPITGIGIDLSTPAIEHAAQRFPALTWVVANADRRLPLLDRSVDLVLSLHGRRHPAEAARVLRPSGVLLVALPAPDDLIELRTLVQGQAVTRDRSEGLLTEHQPLFTVVDRLVVKDAPLLGRDAMRLLLRGTYRGERHAAAERLADVEEMQVTLASDVFVMRPAQVSAAASRR